MRTSVACTLSGMLRMNRVTRDGVNDAVMNITSKLEYIHDAHMYASLSIAATPLRIRKPIT